MRNLVSIPILGCWLIAATLAAREVNINHQYLGRRLAEMQDDEDPMHFSDGRNIMWKNAGKRTRGSSIKSKLKALLNLERQEDLAEERTITTKTKDTKKRYGQTYNGIPVFDTVVTASQTDLTDVTGHIWIDIDSDVKTVKPKLTAAQAFGKAKAAEGDNIGRVKISIEKNTLMIYTDKKGKAYLAYVLNYYCSREPNVYKRPYYVIDAMTGKVLRSWQGLTTIANDHDITFDGGNKGTRKQRARKIKVKESRGDCIMRNDDGVHVVNMNGAAVDNSAPDKSPYEFRCTDGLRESETNGAYSPLGDAMYFASATVRMYKEWINVEPDDIANIKIGVFVHVNDEKPAFWDVKGAHFTDGNSTFFPAIVADTVAHEISHGFTEKYSQLSYDRTESGAINEAFSDIAGETAEKYIKTQVDWKVGAEMVKPRTQAGIYYLGRDAIRYFDKPSKDGKSIDTADKHTGDMKTHYGSGPYRLAFHKLITAQHWEFKDAIKVFAGANMNYWRPSTGFNEGLCGLRAAANDVFGKIPKRQKDLTDAFAQAKIRACEEYGTETLLQRNVKVEIGTLKKGAKKNFEYFIPGGCESLTVTVQGGRGRLTIYQKRGSPPGDVGGTYDHTKAGSGTVQLEVRDQTYLKKKPAVASYFVTVKAVDDISGYKIEATFVKKTYSEPPKAKRL